MATNADLLKRQLAARLESQKKTEKVGLVKGTTRSFVEGATFGFADEIGIGAAALAASLQFGKPFWEVYQDMKTSYTAEQKRFEADHPVISTGAKVAGAVGTGFALARGAAAAAPGLAARPILAGAAGGAIEGAAFGAGEAETMADIPREAGTGALIGGAFGGGFPAAVKSLGGAKRLISGPKSKAGRLVSEAIERDQMTPAQMASRMRQLGPEAVVADVGENVRSLGRAVTSVPGQAKTQAAKTIRERMSRSQQRLLSEIKDAAGADKGFFEAMSESLRRRIAQSRPLYQQAADDMVPVDRMQNVLGNIDNQLVQYEGTAIGRALKIARSKLAPDGNVKRSIAQLDAVKKDIDDMIAAAGRSGQKNRQRVLIDVLRNDDGTGLLQLMDESSPSYAQARKIFADEASVENAMKSGLKVLKEDAEITIQKFSDFSEAEKQAYVIGAMKAIRDKVLSGAEGADASRKISTTLLKERLRPIFPDEQSFQRFVRSLDREQTFAQTRNAVLGGSPTARIQEEIADLGSQANAVIDAFVGSPVNATANVLRRFFSRRKDIPEKLRKELGELLFTPGNGDQVVALLRQRLKAKEIRRLLFELEGAATAGSIAAAQ